jgi:hypothetical protein
MTFLDQPPDDVSSMKPVPPVMKIFICAFSPGLGPIVDFT